MTHCLNNCHGTPKCNCNCTCKSYSSQCHNNNNALISSKRTKATFDKSIDYKDSQKESLLSLKDLLVNIISSIQNSFGNDPECYKKEALNAADQYILISNRTCDSKKISVIGNGKLYGTVQDISGECNFPVYSQNGFGGIRELHDISGTLIYDLNGNNQTSFILNENDDVAFLAKKIKEKTCNYLSIVNGTEIGLKFDCSENTVFTMTILSKELGNNYSTFKIISDACECDYQKLIEEIKNAFEQYIDQIWYDILDENIRIIFNAAYSVFISNENQSGGSIIFETFINDKLITSINVTPGDNFVAYGYLEFYSSCHSLTIRYPPKSLRDSYEDVHMKLISFSDEGCCNNITFKLENLWCCLFDTIAKICIQYDRCYKNTIEVKAFNSWALLLKNMIKCLNFDCSVYDNWRRCNVIKNIDSLISLLDNLIIIIENQRELLIIMKCDFIEFIEKCSCNLQYSRY